MARVIASVDSMFSLSRFVESVRTVAPVSGRACLVDRLPDGRTSLVFRVIEEGRRGDITVVGPRTRSLLKKASGFVKAVILDFKPGWSRPLLGGPANELKNEFIALEHLWGPSATALYHELLGTTSVPEFLDRIAHAFAVQLSPTFEPVSARLARHAARVLDREDVRVDALAERLGVTTRHLHRAFVENVGVGPKEFVRSIRLQRALRLAATSSDWGRVALDAGYYDQSHLIADFQKLVGLTPGAFLKRANEFGAAALLAPEA
ncbi:helix-turn-helix domain-containing protein [Hyalangium versicolor]|uniref:helix-turn-helix domain-containing protein n=1 Tax=Hyalangium versicolor TaxID=2861190 RepID=UPI001CC8F767|nr:helix-turn-helix transcriptional regulator [Hyalangium versicolor]